MLRKLSQDKSEGREQSLVTPKLKIVSGSITRYSRNEMINASEYMKDHIFELRRKV